MTLNPSSSTRAAPIPLSTLADPGAGNFIGSVGGAAAAAKPPGSELAYVQITATVNIASTTEATPTTIVSSGAVACDGGAIWIAFSTPALNAPLGVPPQSSYLLLLEDGVSVGRIAVLDDVSGTVQQDTPVSQSRRRTPAAGSHTYIVAAFADTINGTPCVVAGDGAATHYAPAKIVVTKV